MARKATRTPPRTRTRHPVSAKADADFVKEVVTEYGKDLDADRHNIEPARQDHHFVLGHQWDHNVKMRRERQKKPVLTVNRFPAFIGQFVGAWLQNDTTIKVVATSASSKIAGEIRQGLIRATTRTREAKHALSVAMTNAYICGVGNFRVSLRDAKNDVFLRDMHLEKVDDPFGVIWDRASTDPTGADAQHCYVTEYMTKKDFAKTYPKAGPDSGWVSDELDSTIMTLHGLDVDEMVRVAHYWQMREEPVVLGLEAETGDVIDLTDVPEDDRIGLVAPDNDGNPMIRETVRPFAECYVITSTQILEGPYRLDISRLPVFRVEGWALQEAGVRYRWGFVRNAKDPQRLHNYWRSVLAEELQKSVSTKWLLDNAGGKNQYADQFRNAHLSQDGVLFWDSEAGGQQPQQFPPPPTNAALLTEAGMTVQDIKDVTNKHEASLGLTSNEVSGRAITARQRVSELGDVIYIENMNAALAEAGRVMNELIPAVYDTARTVKIMGEDDQEILQEVNGDAGDATPDITVGKYDVTYTTGPSYATKRQEAVDVIMTLMNTMPQVGNVVADILVRQLDIPGADEIEERLAGMLPPGMVDPDRLPARRRQKVAEQQEQAQQKAQQEQQIQQAQLQVQFAKLQAEAAELNARAARQEAQALNEQSQVGVDAFEAQVKADKLEVDAAQAGVKLAELNFKAFQAGLDSALAAPSEDDEAAQQPQQPQKQDTQNGG